MFGIVCAADPVLQVDFPRHFRAHVSKLAAQSRFRSACTVRGTGSRWIPARLPDSLVRRSSLAPGLPARMRPQSVIDILNKQHEETLRIRCSSGAEYEVSAWTVWYFDSVGRTLFLVLDGRTTISLDPMLVESVQVSERETPRRSVESSAP
jgi:hypothetical protein